MASEAEGADGGIAGEVDSTQNDLEPWIALTNHLRSLGFHKSASHLEEELQGQDANEI